MRKFFKKTQSAWEPEKLPRHIAIVMDGNGRWAKKRSLPRTAGHAAGAETFRRIATYCKNIGVEYLTVYAFSTENWKRPPEEVEKIMQLLEKYIIEALGKMERDKVKMKFLGDTTVLSPRLRELVAEAEELSKTFDGVQVNVCLNYGSRDEIIRAVKRYATDQIIANTANSVSNANPKNMEETIGSLTEETFSKYLYTADIPDPDLIIRPSGEHRVSNFLLWQSAYSEYYFTDALWPDFSEKELDKAIMEYQSRERRYGGV